MTVRPKRMLSDKFPVEYEPEAGGRIGLCPRTAMGSTSVADADATAADAARVNETAALSAAAALATTPAGGGGDVGCPVEGFNDT